MSMTFEDLLAKEGTIVYKTCGASMEPMLRQNRDLVIIQVPSLRLRKYDVALYRRNHAYVLHRVIRVKKDRYLIRGDNTFSLETVPQEAVIGVLTGFQRKGKYVSADDIRYRFYVYIWVTLYPVRLIFHCSSCFAIGIARKAGILSIIKRIFRRGDVS